MNKKSLFGIVVVALMLSAMTASAADTSEDSNIFPQELPGGYWKISTTTETYSWRGGEAIFRETTFCNDFYCFNLSSGRYPENYSFVRYQSLKESYEGILWIEPEQILNDKNMTAEERIHLFIFQKQTTVSTEQIEDIEVLKVEPWRHWNSYLWFVGDKEQYYIASIPPMNEHELIDVLVKNTEG